MNFQELLLEAYNHKTFPSLMTIYNHILTVSYVYCRCRLVQFIIELLCGEQVFV